MKIITAAILDELTFFGMVAHVIMRIVPLVMVGITIHATWVYTSNPDRFVSSNGYDVLSPEERIAHARRGYRNVVFLGLGGALIVGAIVGDFTPTFFGWLWHIVDVAVTTFYRGWDKT